MQRKWKWAIVLAFAGLFALGLLLPSSEAPEEVQHKHISYSSFMKDVAAGNVVEVVVNEDDRLLVGKTGEGVVLTTHYAQHASVTDKLLASSAEVRVMPPGTVTSVLDGIIRTAPRQQSDSDAGTSWVQILSMGAFSILLIVLLFLGIGWMMRRSMGNARQAMQFGKSRAKKFEPDDENRVTYDDCHGIDPAVEAVKVIRDFLRNPDKYRLSGARMPKGFLFVGAPGGGKTLLARATAYEAGVPFFFMSGSEFVEMFVGVGAARVRSLFEEAAKHESCIVFIDEIDALGRRRGAGLGNSNDEREQTLNQLLVEMDGLSKTSNIILIAATNRPDILDPALLRPGRFDKKIEVPPLSQSGRLSALCHFVKKNALPLDADVDLEVISRMTSGLTGADIESLVNEAALVSVAAERDIPGVSQNDFLEARLTVMAGSPNGVIQTEEDKRRTAYHEAGHVLAAWDDEHGDPVEFVTILPRGRSLGLTMTLPERERYCYTEKWMYHRLRLAFGGREAEKLIFNDYSSGAEQDLRMATSLARAMVTKHGMSELLGPVALEKDEGPLFLGQDMAKRQEYSEATAREIDKEIRRLLTESQKSVIELLEKERTKLEALAEALLEQETLSSAEIRELFARL